MLNKMVRNNFRLVLFVNGYLLTSYKLSYHQCSRIANIYIDKIVIEQF